MKLVFLSALALALSSVSASAVTLLSYDSAGGVSSLTGSTSAAGVTAEDLAAGSGIAPRTPSSTFNFRNWDTDNASFADAIADDEIWTWGFTSSVAYDLTSLSLELDRSASGPGNVLIELAINGGAFDSVLSFDFGASDTPEDFAALDLSSFTQVTEADFRLSAFGSTSLAGTFDLEDSGTANDLFVTGEVSAVPVPAPALMLLSGLLALGAMRLRRTA